MKLCGVIGQKSGMTEPRPCMRKAHHVGSHTYDLTGMKDVFGFKEILRRGPDYIERKSKRHITRWWVFNSWGGERLVWQAGLFSGNSRGLCATKGTGTNDKKGRQRSEYKTIAGHLNNIFNLKAPHHNSYKNMSFFDGWNSKKGGSILTGMRWILENLGPKPGSNWHIHVIKSKKYPYGFFGPGGIVWRNRMDKHDQDLLDLVYDWSKKKRKNFIKELEKIQ